MRSEQASELVRSLYEAFATTPKPAGTTDHPDCAECAEYNELLHDVAREDLTIEQAGTVSWGPVAFLKPVAMAYYLPRLTEFAINQERNSDGGSYICQFLIQIGLHPAGNARFSQLTNEQKYLVGRCFEFIVETYRGEIEEECCEEWIPQVQRNWPV